MAQSKRPAALDKGPARPKATGRPRPAGGKRRPIAAPDTMPAAGPHAKGHLTDPAKTPGAGTLADPARPQDGNATSG